MTDLHAFHAFLRGELPSTERELVQRLEICHRALPKSYVGFPRTAAEVSEALRQLAAAGLADKRGAEWWWLREPVKEDQERRMFA